MDTFYLTTWDKYKINSPEQQVHIETRLREAIDALDAA